MTRFAELPFADQLAWIDRAIEGSDFDARALIEEAAALPDVEPLLVLVERLAEVGALEREVFASLFEALRTLSDPSLAAFVSAPLAHAKEARAALFRDALSSWGLERVSALALLHRWAREHEPSHARDLADRALEEVGRGEAVDTRWLFFVAGPRLAELAEDSTIADPLRSTTRAVLETLARAPKSLSQANAERLLARRVYADSGHFLFELMQNADDAGASSWEVHIEPERTVVTHDGAPFSFLDVVGICSIGLTTKSRDQIGLFGVGFKSVFEITERPRVHSGAFDFEIAHVSMPRAIEPIARSAADATTLVLPHRGQVDAARLARRAAAIEPETLMTLPHLQRLVVAGPEVDEVYEERRSGTRVTLLGSRGERQFEVEAGVLEHEESRLPVLVAAAVDRDGDLRAHVGAGLFAFLPTAEPTGLPVLVHARFEVTVDRERLEADSARNQALLEEAGRRYASLIARCASSGRAVLEALPGAPHAPAMRPLVEALGDALRKVPCLPGADGSLVAPHRAWIADPELAEALAAEDLGAGSQTLRLEGETHTFAARSLGARDLGDDALLAWLEQSLVPSEGPPDWLGDAVFAALGSSSVGDERLRALPLLCAAGGLVSADLAQRAGAPWVHLYEGIRPVIGEVSLRAMDARLRARLAVPAFDPHTLPSDLVQHPTLLARNERLLDALEEAPDDLLRALRESPIFASTDGAMRSAQDGIRVLAPELEPLRDSIAEHTPLLRPEVAARHPQLARRALDVLGVAELIALLADGLEVPATSRPALLEVLTDALPELPARLAELVARAPLFEDTHGTSRPLLGQGAALRERSELRRLLPAWPWLAEPDAPLVALCGLAPIEPREVVEALRHRSLEEADLPSLLGWLGAHADSIPPHAADALADVALWPDSGGAPTELRRLRNGAISPALDDFYEATDLRRVAHPSVSIACRRLRLARHLPASDFEAFADDLLAHSDPASLPSALVTAALVAAARELPATRVPELRDAPVFEDADGARRSLGLWSAPSAERCHRAGRFRALLRDGPWPLLEASLEEPLAPFLERAGVAEPTVVDLARAGQSLDLPPDAMLAALLEHADDVDEEARAAIAELPLFEARDGTRHRASALAHGEQVVTRLGARRAATLGLESALASPIAAAAIGRLGLELQSPRALFESQVLGRLRVDVPLVEQPEGAAGIDDLLAILDVTEALELDVRAYPLALDRGGSVRVGPLRHGPEEVLALASQLSMASRLAEPSWASDARSAALLEPLGPRAIAAALRDECREEQPRVGHPTLTDVGALYDWLRAEGPALSTDEDALSALGGACVIASPRGTLRAPRDLVFDDRGEALGLDWGVADDVPSDIARWLGAHFEIDKAQRRALVEHVLDAIDDAVEAGRPSRLMELVGFLATSLDADTLDFERLEKRARRLKVRARLRVPTADGDYVKPRFGWAPTAERAVLADAFLVEPPPELGSREHGVGDDDRATRALLEACGAAADLSDTRVLGLLDGDGLREGGEARVALARYVLGRATEQPHLIERWGLSERKWVPDVSGAVRRPRALLWPGGFSGGLFDGAPNAADPALRGAASEPLLERLGFLSSETVTLRELAPQLQRRAADPELLTLLERGLEASRFSPSEIASSVRPRLWVRDDEGTPRPVAHLALDGARALFGRSRGDASSLRQRPLLTRALGVPRTPDVNQMRAFLEERGAALSSLEDSERLDLADHVPAVYRALADHMEGGARVDLPPDAVVCALRGADVVLTRLSDPELRLLGPDGVLEALSDDALDATLGLEVSSEALRVALLEAGVGDLLAGSETLEVTPGPATDDDASALHERLQRGLAGASGKRCAVHETLTITARLAVSSARGSGSGYRGGAPQSTTVAAQVSAALDADTLRVTPEALNEPWRIAAALETEPRRRARLIRWLSEERPDRPAPPKKRAPSTDPAPAKPSDSGWLSRVRSWFESDEPPPPPDTGEAPLNSKTDDAAMFRPEHQVRAQLEGEGDWSEGRRQRPRFGFRFSPDRLANPWQYAPKLIAVHFDRGSQSWRPAPLERPESRGGAGEVHLRGSLPKGDSVLPVPLYGRVSHFESESEASTFAQSTGARVVRLPRGGPVSLTVTLGVVGDASRATPADLPDALASFVPDSELPEEVLDFIDGLDDDALAMAFAIRDFVRRRYRYDPSYLEDRSVGRWLARVSRGRANAHVAALHAGADARHLGAGVCYELNALTCEMMRRAQIPAGIATGWVFDGGSLSEPDHLWALAFLEGRGGEALWVPIDASSTVDGRALRVSRRPPVRARPPKKRSAKAPKPPRWDRSPEPSPGRGAPTRARSSGGRERPKDRPKRRKKKKPPTLELRRLLRYLEQRTGEPIADADKERLEAALQDPKAARALVARLLKGA